MWDWSLNGPDCWSSDDGLPSRFVNTVAMLEANRLYAGTSEGVGIIDTSTGTLVDVWTAAADSDQTDIVVVGSIAYLGVQGVGIARYDLNTETWLSTWDASSGLISNDLITLLKRVKPGDDMGGGYFGLVNIDTTTGQLNTDWNLGPNSDGPTLPYEPPSGRHSPQRRSVLPASRSLPTLADPRFDHEDRPPEQHHASTNRHH